MTKLAASIIEAVRHHNISVEYVDRETAKHWSDDRIDGAPVSFTGFYWNQIHKGRVVLQDGSGPFKCYSAAVANAYTTLQLHGKRRHR